MKNILRFLVPVFIFILQFYTKIVISSSHDSHYIMHKCEKRNDTYTTGSTFQSTLNDTLLSILPDKASRVTFANSANGTGIDQVNALFYCRGDVGTLACYDCVQAAAVKLTQRCQYFKEAVVWFEECTLRYANRSILFIDEESPMHIYTNNSGIMNDYFLDPFKDVFDIAMDDIIKQAASLRKPQGFATTQVNLSSTEVLHCTVQCTPDISGAYCERCLKSALKQRDRWADTMILMPSCFIRVDLYDSTDFSISDPPHSKGLSTTVIVIISVGCGVFFVVAILAAFLCYVRYWPDLAGDSPRNTTLRKFKFIQLLVATNGFIRLNYLGKGSFGRVYSGVLRGEKLAVKRLIIVKDGSQGNRPLQSLEEFLTEIKTNFQAVHHNIVKVVGYCNEGKHKLLVYELIENKSLKMRLHGTRKKPGNLAWENRKKIAVGCAKGLHYLHEKCKIIHRDIKPSNILLDSNYEPKLADFGLAKAFLDDDSYVRTVAKGTPGYLDPEYSASNMLTEKSDVYSFGVVLLELITGKKPTPLETPRSKSLSLVHGLQSDAIGSPVDEKLFKIEDRDWLNRMIICAALCTHPSGDGRLSMGQVVELLEEGSVRANDVAHIMVYARMDPPTDLNNRMDWSELTTLAVKVLQIEPAFPSYCSPVVENIRERQGTANYSAITSNGSEIHQIQQSQGTTDASHATTSNAPEIYQVIRNTQQIQGSTDTAISYDPEICQETEDTKQRRGSTEATTSRASEISQDIENNHQNQGSTDITTSEASEMCQVIKNTHQNQGSTDVTTMETSEISQVTENTPQIQGSSDATTSNVS